MNTEFEAKFYPIDKDCFRKKLPELGAELIVPERKMRISEIDQRVYPQINSDCDHLRVRDEGNGIVRLSVKMGGQEEIDVVVGDYEKTLAILAILGFKPNRYVERLRETWSFKETEVLIDTWPCLEPFVEIEGASEGKVREVSLELGLDWDRRFVGYASFLFAKKYNLDHDEVIKKMEYLTFENNPFAGLPRKSL